MELNNNIYIVIPYTLYLSEAINNGRINLIETEAIISYVNTNEIPMNIVNGALFTFNHMEALNYVNSSDW